MSIGKSLLVILALFGLSWIGIVIGWLSWDQDRYYGDHLLKHSSVLATLLILAAGVMVLVTGAIVVLKGAASLPFAAATGVVAGLISYVLGRTQLRSR